MDKKILGIDLKKRTKKEILEEVGKDTSSNDFFVNIVSINPESLVIAQQNHEYKKIIQTAQIKIIDGTGIVLAGRILNTDVGTRIPGVDLVQDLLKGASQYRLRVLLIGGRPKIAELAANCQKQLYPKLEILGIEGISDIKNPMPEEEKNIFSIVADYKPHFVFAAFGMPYQELWLHKNREKLKNCVVMGVGGTLDYLVGKVPRAPFIFRRVGLEWLFRLIIQPWRLRRQLRLLTFLYLVILQKLNLKKF